MFAAAWLKRMFREMGRKDVTVAKLCGTNSNKETVMEGFGTGRSVNTTSSVEQPYAYCWI